MTIEKFFPQSPDPNLNVGPDMTLARFGHLNKLVDDINAGCGGGGGGGIIDNSEGLLTAARIGVGNLAFGDYGSALTGFNNLTCNDFTANTWGRNNIAKGCYSSVNGTSNIVCARNSHILSGTNNTIACDAPQYTSAQITCSTYAGNYFGSVGDWPTSGGIVCGKIGNTNQDLTAVWPVGSTFSYTYVYSSGDTTSCSSYYSQIQGVNIEVLCSCYSVGNETIVYFCYDPTSPSFIGTQRPDCGGCTYSFGYIQKTGTFNSYSTYSDTYHPNTIAGGAFNTITGFASVATISGGYQNTVSGGYATISGGYYNYISGGGTIAGNSNNRMFSSPFGFIGGGRTCICNSFGGSVLGSYHCMHNANASSILGGSFSAICFSQCSSIGGGQRNVLICASHSTISGGYCNTNIGSGHSLINGGRGNTLCTTPNSSEYNMILGGCGNYNCAPSASYNTLLGRGNSILPEIASSGFNFIGGVDNIICGVGSNNSGNFIYGVNNITSGHSFTAVLGCCITVNRSNALHVNNLSIRTIPTSSAGLPSGSVWSNAGVLTIVP